MRSKNGPKRDSKIDPTAVPKGTQVRHRNHPRCRPYAEHNGAPKGTPHGDKARPRPATKRPRGNGLGAVRLPPHWCETMRKNHHEKQIATENNNLKPLFLYLKNICIFVFLKHKREAQLVEGLLFFAALALPPKCGKTVRQTGPAKQMATDIDYLQPYIFMTKP